MLHLYYADQIYTTKKDLEHQFPITTPTANKPYRSTHSIPTSSCLFILSVNTFWLSCMRSSNRSLACSSLSPSFLTGRALHLRKSVATTDTNSTCDIFIPGHERGPIDQDMYVPWGGVMKTGSGELGSSQRVGLNSRESGPHVEGRVCRAIVLMYAPNGPASEEVRSSSFKV